MKKVYQLIATATLSLMMVGAFAQSPVNVRHKAKPINSNDRFAKASQHSNTKKTTGANQNALIDYLVGDQSIATGATFYYWAPVLALNSAYTIADTGTTDNLLSNSAIVTFDTIYDLYSNGFVSPINPGAVTVDTLAAEIQYHNTSGKNDTIIFTICGVDVNGFATVGTVYGVDTAVITPGFFSATSNTLDSIQFITLVKSTVIPASARHGYNFAVSTTVKGPKTDTVALVYYSQGSSGCAALGGDFTPAPTYMGVKDGAQPAVNSFVNGLYYQNDKGQHGTNVSMLWPITKAGKTQGFCENGGGYYSSPLSLVAVGFTSCVGDTNWWDVQDIAIFPSISIAPKGINEVSADGLDVNQNYPNPFNKATQINYSVTKSSDVVFNVYDLTGRKIMGNTYSEVAPGQHIITLSANQFTPGVYFYTFNVNGNVVTKRMVITE
jgi:hypothetical protein